jgi:hypothetical protein
MTPEQRQRFQRMTPDQRRQMQDRRRPAHRDSRD